MQNIKAKGKKWSKVMIKILIVEDEEKIARFIELELVHEGYKVIKVNNGRTGLEIAEKGRSRFSSFRCYASRT